MTNEIAHKTAQQGEIILYQPDETVRLEVRLEDDTVWLTQAQMAELFQTTKNNITIHIGNVYKEKELLPQPTSKESLLVRMEGHRQVTREVKLYNLDVIISVGYRVKSQRGTEFRQWANKVIKDYLLHGYAFNQRLLQIEERIDARLEAHTQTEQQRFLQIESTLADHQQKIDFFVRTNQPPVEGIFFDGQIFDAYRFVNNLIRKAKNRVVLIDEEVYHIGASLKDLGRKWFAFTLMHDITTAELITRISGSATVNIEQ